MTRAKTNIFFLILLLVRGAFLGAQEQYSSWSFFGGIGFINNEDGTETEIPGMNLDGSPGGLSSAPSPLPTFLGFDYAIPMNTLVSFNPSLSFWAVQYGYTKGRALPVELENRTAYVPSLLLDIPLLFNFKKNSFSWGFGPGLSILIRYAFLELGIPGEEQNVGELSAQDQVDSCNSFFWDKGRWFYPTIQVNVKYALETGWGAGLTVRTGIPIFNAWDTTSPAPTDNLLLLVALSITPPKKNK